MAAKKSRRSPFYVSALKRKEKMKLMAMKRHRYYLIPGALLFTATLSFLFDFGPFSDFLPELDLNTDNTKLEQRLLSELSLSFDDIELDKYLGGGYVSLVFNVRIPKLDNRSYVMKVTGDEFLHYSNLENEMFDLLNKPPTNPSIPTQAFRVKSMRESSPLIYLVFFLL